MFIKTVQPIINTKLMQYCSDKRERRETTPNYPPISFSMALHLASNNNNHLVAKGALRVMVIRRIRCKHIMAVLRAREWALMEPISSYNKLTNKISSLKAKLMLAKKRGTFKAKG